VIQEAVRPEEVRVTLEDLLNSNGIPSDEVTPNPVLEWLGEFFSMGGGTVVEWGLWTVGAFIVAGALYILVQAVRNRRRRFARPEEEHRKFEQVRRRVFQLRADALAAEAAGDHALALRLFLFALVVGLGENGELEFRPAWTNRELIDRGRPKPAVERTLTALLDELDPKTFGSVPAEAADVHRMERVCDDLLGKYAA